MVYVTAQDVADLLKDVEQQIAGYQQDAEAGKMMNMAPLEEKIVRLCDQVANLPAAEAKRFEMPLQNLMDNLQRFSEDLARRRDEIRKQLSGLGAHMEAQSAYARAAGYTEPKKS